MIGIATGEGEGVLDANDELLRMLGRTREELAAGKLNWRELTPPEQCARSDQAVREALESGRFAPFEKDFLHRDGRRVPTLVGGRCLGREPFRYVAFILDLSALKGTEAALRRSEERFRLIVESARDYAIFTLDAGRRVTSWNPGAEAILGFPEEAILGRSGDLIFTPEDRALAAPEQEAEQARAQGRAEDERWHLRRDGTRFWGSGLMMAMRAPEGGEPGFLKILRDMTAMHEAEQARRLAEDRFGLVVQSVKDYAIFTLDPAGRVTSWNAGAARIKGYRAEEILGRDAAVFFPPDQLAAGEPARALAQAAAEGRCELEGWRLRKGGEKFWAEELITPLRDEAGALLGFAVLCRDLSERKRLEDGRARLLLSERAAREEAERALEGRDRFLAMVSHELRTPLTPVMMAAHIIGREPRLSGPAREALAMIRRNVALEARLIDELLDLSRITHGKLELDAGPLDLHACLRHALETCQEEADGKQLKVSLGLRARRSQVCGDAARLQQVFSNLLRNAVKFTPEGGSITVRSRAGVGRNRVRVEVADTGIGIEPAALARIFEPFEQGSAEVTRRFGGLGLGLAIARALVEAHGGRLAAGSPGLGRGAVFAVEMPTVPAGEARR